MPDPVKKILCHIKRWCCVVCVGIALSGAGEAAGLPDFLGVWQGHTADEVPVDLRSLSGNVPEVFEFSYDVPFSCYVTARKSMLKDHTLTLVIIETSGNPEKCDPLYQGKIILTLSGKDNLKADILHKNGDREDTASLSR